MGNFPWGPRSSQHSLIILRQLIKSSPHPSVLIESEAQRVSQKHSRWALCCHLCRSHWWLSWQGHWASATCCCLPPGLATGNTLPPGLPSWLVTGAASCSEMLSFLTKALHLHCTRFINLPQLLKKPQISDQEQHGWIHPNLKVTSL